MKNEYIIINESIKLCEAEIKKLEKMKSTIEDMLFDLFIYAEKTERTMQQILKANQ